MPKQKPPAAELYELIAVKGYTANRVADRYDTSADIVRRWVFEDIELTETLKKNGIRAQRNAYGQPRRVKGDAP